MEETDVSTVRLIWVPVLQEMASNYEVSNFGKVRRKSYYVEPNGKRKRELIPSKPIKISYNWRGYATVSLYLRNGKRKTYLVSTLVMKSFTPERHWTKQIRHLDGDLSNNKFSNLEWNNPVARKKGEVPYRYLSAAGRLARKKQQEEEYRKKRELIAAQEIPEFTYEDEKGEEVTLPVYPRKLLNLPE